MKINFVLRIVLLFAVASMLFGIPQIKGVPQAAAEMPPTGIVANPKAHWVMAAFWPLGVKLTLTIGNYTDQSIVEVAPWDPNTNEAWFDLPAEINLMPGDVVTISGAGVTKSITIEKLSVTGIDAANDTITGIAAPGAIVEARANSIGNNVFATTNSEGVWMLKPSTGGIALAPGVSGYVMIWDLDGDLTREDWRVPKPFFEVRVPGYVMAVDWWPVGETVTLSVGNHQFTQTTKIASWSSDYTDATFNTVGTYEIKAGDLVTLTDGKSTKTTIVSPLKVTKVDYQNDLVSGIAGPGPLTVWASNTPDLFCVRYVIANSNGIWLADFKHPGQTADEKTTLNINPGTGVDSSQWDVDGDLSSYGWNAIPPVYLPLIVR